MKGNKTQINNISAPISSVGVMIFKKGKILLGKRKTSPGEGTYAFPGGKMESGETPEECAIRETMEEAGIRIKNLKTHFVAISMHFLPRQYTHFGIMAEWKSGIPMVMEPDKKESWDWYSLNNLPKPIFKGVEMSLIAYKKKYNYFDSKKWRKI